MSFNQKNPFYFVQNIFLNLDFIHGTRGFLLAATDSFYYFMIYAKLYELNCKRVFG